MTFGERFDIILNSTFFHYFYFIGGIFLVIVGILLYLGIKTKGRVLVIDQIFKKKHFDREILRNRYLIQAGYTVLFGIMMISAILFMPYDGVRFLVILIIFGVLDFLYDFFAIRSASAKSVDDVMNEEA